MELPDFSFKKFKKESDNKSETCEYLTITERATANDVRDYYQFYVKKKKLEKYLLSYATVTNVRKIVSLFSTYNSTNNELWEVSGFVQSNNEQKYEFRYLCKHLIVAVGAAGLYNELNVKGENSNFVLHTIHDLEDKIKTQMSYLKKYPLLIIGAGLSAADSILLAQKYRIKVVHVIRRSVFDKNIVYPKLPKIMYPEYHSIYAKMVEYKQNSSRTSKTNENYILYDEHCIKRFNANHTCIIEPNVMFEDDFESQKEIKFSFVCLLIGQKINLDFIEPDICNKLAYNSKQPINIKDNPISINPYTYETSNFKNLYAMGPLIGDNFVRFGIAGALGITNHLWKGKKSAFNK